MPSLTEKSDQVAVALRDAGDLDLIFVVTIEDPVVAHRDSPSLRPAIATCSRSRVLGILIFSTSLTQLIYWLSLWVALEECLIATCWILLRRGGNRLRPAVYYGC